MDKNKPIIGITMGDAAGVGPEIIVKTLSMRETREVCRPVVIGDMGVLREAQRTAHIALETHSIGRISEASFREGVMDILDLANMQIDKLRMGEPQAMAGKASFEYVQRATQLALQHEIDAITTAPISKEALRMAGVMYPGHTEMLADLTHSERFAMMFVAEPLMVVLATIHVSLREAIDLVTKDRVLLTIRLADEATKKFGVVKPRIAVTGLNPHAGEGKMFGSEDADEIAPATAEANREGLNVTGPLPADTVFYRAYRGEFDVVVAMYHDQGLIPIKLLGFERGVNVTVGLPIVRTSPDHGTAYDLARAGLGNADPTSLLNAIKIASKLSSA